MIHSISDAICSVGTYRKFHWVLIDNCLFIQQKPNAQKLEGRILFTLVSRIAAGPAVQSTNIVVSVLPVKRLCMDPTTYLVYGDTFPPCWVYLSPTSE